MSDNAYDDQGPHSGRKLQETNAGERSIAAQPVDTQQPPKSGVRRGFAAMDQQTQREIARKGGHSQGKENNRGNFWHDRERARAAGRKGGEAHGKNRQEPARQAEPQ
jgi:general stress protein YciG